MKRLHIHVAVEDLRSSIRFYSGLFGTPPTVEKPDYAKWQIEDPRMNFAISMRGVQAVEGGQAVMPDIGVNHLGIQVESDEELAEMHARLRTLEAEVEEEPGTACCYVKSDKYWVSDPSGIPWEAYHTLESIPIFGGPNTENADECCVPASTKGKLASKVAEATCCTPKTKNTSNCC